MATAHLQLLIEVRQSEKCPQCGKAKEKENLLCGKCYHRLPEPMRRSLRQRQEEALASALARAMKFLEARRMAEEKQARK